MSCPKVLQEAIEGLYIAFSGYPLPEDTMPCDCCHTPLAEPLVHAETLRSLQWKHLRDYADDALTTWGDLDVFKHFLPRIFDLLLNSGERWSGVPNPEIVFRKLNYGEWRSWSQEEQSAIERMLQAVWETIRSNPPIVGGYIDLEMWLCSISQCENDLSPYLQEWMEDERLSASWALSSLILGSTIAYTGTDHSMPLREEDEDEDARVAKIQAWFNLPQRGAFWENCNTQYSQLQDCVRSPAAIEKLRRAEVSCGNDEMKREFAAARRCLREAQSTKWEPVYRDRIFQTAYWVPSTNRLY
jgi:hypothetical protein